MFLFYEYALLMHREYSLLRDMMFAYAYIMYTSNEGLGDHPSSQITILTYRSSI